MRQDNCKWHPNDHRWESFLDNVDKHFCRIYKDYSLFLRYCTTLLTDEVIVGINTNSSFWLDVHNPLIYLRKFQQVPVGSVCLMSLSDVIFKPIYSDSMTAFWWHFLLNPNILTTVGLLHKSFLKNWLDFMEQFKVHGKIEGRYRDFPYTSCPHTRMGY